jgi:predicted RNase H-like HicB family nuclease
LDHGRENRIRKNAQSLEIEVEVLLVKEGEYWVSYAPSLKLSSYGDSQAEAKKGFAEALTIFIDETMKKGTLERLLIDYGWILPRNWVNR